MDRTELRAKAQHLADQIANCLGMMSGADRAEWRQAANLADVGQLTARWLSGELGAQPNYLAPVDIDDEPGMTEALIDLNRAGVVTTGSQAAYDGPGYDGAHWSQRAAVQALAAEQTVTDLRQHLADHDGLVVADREGGFFAGFRPVAPVTCREASVVTDFGVRHPLGDHMRACPQAADELADAEQVVVYDAEWGRNDRLWPALQDFAHTQQQAHVTDVDIHDDTDGM